MTPNQLLPSRASLPTQSASRPDWLERILYSTAAAFTIMVTVMLLVSYLPGGPTQLPTLFAFDAISLVLFGWVWWRGRRMTPGAPVWPFDIDRRWFWAGVITLLVAGAIFRFVGLGYSDYQGDEARAALRGRPCSRATKMCSCCTRRGRRRSCCPRSSTR